MGILSYIKIAGLVAILAAAGAAYFYVKGLQEENVALQTQVGALQGQVKGLEQEQQQLRAVQQGVNDDLAAYLQVDSKAAKDANTLRLKLNERSYREKQERVKESDRALLYLRLVNRDTRCQWVNFTRDDGSCKNGRFVEEERAVAAGGVQ